MGRVIHFEIHAADTDRAQRFYTEVFGWGVQNFGGPMDYRLLITGPDGEAGINGAILKRQGDAPAAGAAGGADGWTIQGDSVAGTERAGPAPRGGPGRRRPGGPPGG